MDKRSILIVAFFLMAVTVGAPAQESGTPLGIEESQSLVGTYFNQKEFDTELMFNNKGPDPLEVVVKFFRRDGRKTHSVTVTVPGVAFITESVADLLAGVPAFHAGNLRVIHAGKKLQLGVQVILTSRSGDATFSEQLVQHPGVGAFPAQGGATVMEGVWWLPSEDSEITVVATNLSDLAITGRVVFGGSANHQIPLRLRPHETREITFNNAVTRLGSNFAGVTVEHSGPSASVMVRGMVQDPAFDYTGSIKLSDPRLAVTSEFHGAGLRFRDPEGNSLTPIILIRNHGFEQAEVLSTLRLRVGDGFRSLDLPLAVLPAGDTALWQDEITTALENAAITPAEIDSAGLEVRYSTSPGSVSVDVLSLQTSGRTSFQVPMNDPGQIPASAGGFPWTLEDNQNSVFYVKNVTNSVQKYKTDFTFEGGSYATGIQVLEPGETVAFDLREIREGFIRDEQGNFLPDDVNRGQIRWSEYMSDRRGLIAYVEISDPIKGQSRSYACFNCCPDSFAASRLRDSVDPLTQGYRFYPQQRDVNCYGATTSWFNVNSEAFFSSTNSSVAQVSAGGNVTVSPIVADATITASWFWEQYGQEAPADCDLNVGSTFESFGGGNEMILFSRMYFQRIQPLPDGGARYTRCTPGAFCNPITLSFLQVEGEPAHNMPSVLEIPMTISRTRIPFGLTIICLLLQKAKPFPKCIADEPPVP